MSDKRDDGGPAFPNVPDGAGDKWQSWDVGMTLRDYFAGMALQGLCRAPGVGGNNKFVIVSKRAYDYADAMLKARK